MGFLSFIGRVTFSAIFILAAWQKVEDFSIDGGGALVGLTPKLDVLLNNINETLYFNLKLPPQLQTKHLLMLAIGLEGIGGLLFTLGSTLGAYMLLLFLALVTPIMHDFYNFDQSSLEYHHQFIGFLKNLSQFGALLFYLGMKNSANRNKMRKKHVTKPKSL
ncbi:unnamed protein product [Sphagnum compactum]